MTRFIEKVQVNIPFTLLFDSYLDRFVTHELNPEIGLDAAALDRFSPSDFKHIARTLHDSHLSITLHGPFMDLSPGSPDPRIHGITKLRFEQVFRLIPLFQPRAVVFHMGYDKKRYFYARDAWIEKCLETWSWVSDALSAEGTSLMLENVYEHDPFEIRRVLEALQGNGVGFCFDTGHYAAFSRVPLGDWMDTLAPFLGQLHLHDNLGDEDAHLALGMGMIDFKEILTRLRTLKKTPPTGDP